MKDKTIEQTFEGYRLDSLECFKGIRNCFIFILFLGFLCYAVAYGCERQKKINKALDEMSSK